MNALRRSLAHRGARRFVGIIGMLGATLGVTATDVPSASAAASEPGAPPAHLAEALPLLGRISGELNGVLLTTAGGPVTWSLALAPAEKNIRKGLFTLSGAKVRLQVAVTYDTSTGQLSWRAEDGNMDLATWLPALAAEPELAPLLKGLTATGNFTFTGEGSLDKNGRASGGLVWELKDGTIRHEADGWALEGVTLRIGGDAQNLFAGSIPLTLHVRTITASRFGARALSVETSIVEWTRLETRSARIEIAGGEVSVESFAVKLADPVLDVNLLMRDVGLEDLAALVPEALAEARGHAKGSLRLGWSKASGVTVGDGALTLSGDKRAVVRFHPNPGLITRSIPKSVLDHYPGLMRIETGEMALLATKFDVRLTPGGDAEGRSARVLIEGEPVDASLKAPLVLNINVSGPLARLMKLGARMSSGQAAP